MDLTATILCNQWLHPQSPQPQNILICAQLGSRIAI